MGWRNETGNPPIPHRTQARFDVNSSPHKVRKDQCSFDSRAYEGGEAVISVELPWPDKRLSPNARVHWRQKWKANVLAKADTAWILRPWRHEKITTDRAKVSMVFHPPDNRRRDLDNLIASMKGATDGISAAIGIDDSKFSLTYSMGPVCKGGKVVVTLSPYTL